MHKIYSRLRLLDNLVPELKQKIAEGKMSCEAGRIATNLSRDEQRNLAENEKVTISDARAARRTIQLTLLDLESVEVPRVSELDSILNALTNLCTKVPENWEREVLIEAIKAIETLTEKGE